MNTCSLICAWVRARALVRSLHNTPHCLSLLKFLFRDRVKTEMKKASLFDPDFFFFICRFDFGCVFLLLLLVFSSSSALFFCTLMNVRKIRCLQCSCQWEFELTQIVFLLNREKSEQKAREERKNEAKGKQQQQRRGTRTWKIGKNTSTRWWRLRTKLLLLRSV